MRQWRGVVCLRCCRAVFLSRAIGKRTSLQGGKGSLASGRLSSGLAQRGCCVCNLCPALLLRSAPRPREGTGGTGSGGDLDLALVRPWSVLRPVEAAGQSLMVITWGNKGDEGFRWFFFVNCMERFEQNKEKILLLFFLNYYYYLCVRLSSWRNPYNPALFPGGFQALLWVDLTLCCNQWVLLCFQIACLIFMPFELENLFLLRVICLSQSAGRENELDCLRAATSS